MSAISRRTFLAGAASLTALSAVKAQEFRMPNLDTPDALINIRDFGAVGNGFVDDSPALEEALYQAAVTRRGVLIPPGIFRIARSLHSGCYTLHGVGIGLSRLLFDGPTAGITMTPPNDQHPVTVRGLSFIRNGYGSTALTLDYSAQVVDLGGNHGLTTVNRARKRGQISECEFIGIEARRGGWEMGVDCIAGLIVTIRDCNFNGYVPYDTWGGPSPHPGSCAWRFRGTNPGYSNGHPVEFVLSGCSAYNVWDAIIFDGVEGGFVQACNLVGVAVGVFWADADAAQTGFARPQLSVTNSHVNCAHVGVLADNVSGLSVLGNYIVNWPNASGPHATGVLCRGSLGCEAPIIMGNGFDGTLQLLNGVVVERAQRGVIANNTFGARTATGVWLLPGASQMTGAGNTFNSPTYHTILDQGSSNTVS